MLLGISETANVRAFKPLSIVFSTPENLLEGITGDPGTQESHILSWNMFSGNAVDYLSNSECWSFQTFAIVFSTHENLLVGITGALGTQESHILSWNMFSGNAVEYLRNSECWELSNLCHCVQHPWKLTGRDYWSSRNERKPHSKLKHVFRKCSRVSQKQ